MTTATDLFSLKGKTAVVTGASSGLGACFAHVLAEAGANVVVSARRLDRLESVVESIRAAGGEAVAVPCDVADATEVARLMERACEAFGRLDVVVNNAGVVVDGGSTPEKMDHALFQETVNVNLLGVWYCCREAGARMLAGGGGSIINVSSIMGLGGGVDHPAAYQATKAAVNNLTRNLACSWGNRGLRVNALLPGYFPSEMTDQFFALDGYTKYVEDCTAVGRVGRAGELAGPLLLLASDAGSYMTGHLLTVDGGYSASIGGRPFPDSVYAGLRAVFPDGRTDHIGPG